MTRNTQEDNRKLVQIMRAKAKEIGADLIENASDEEVLKSLDEVLAKHGQIRKARFN